MLYYCEYCNQAFVRKYGLTRHINEKRCKFLKLSSNPDDKDVSDHIEQLEKKLEQLKEKTDREIIDLKRKPPNTVNQVLQVICITNNDNYLDMLTDSLGNFDKAIEYIKDCALSNVSGDCKLIEKIYLSCENETIHFSDKIKSKISYYNEHKKKVVENRDSFGKKIANNLQNSYLKGINYLINKNLVNHLCPNKFLEDYDIQTWNNHIYNLSDLHYQRKIISQLNIPIR